MLHSNTNLVKARIRAHILEQFAEWAESEGKTPEACLVEQVNACIWPHEHGAIAPASLRMWEGGMGLCYDDAMRDKVAEWLEQTPAEKERYNGRQAFHTYTRLMQRETCHIYRETIAKSAN